MEVRPKKEQDQRVHDQVEGNERLRTASYVANMTKILEFFFTKTRGRIPTKSKEGRKGQPCFVFLFLEGEHAL